MIEVKTAAANPDPNLLFFHARYNFPALQLVADLQREYRAGDVEIRQLEKFLKTLSD